MREGSHTLERRTCAAPYMPVENTQCAMHKLCDVGTPPGHVCTNRDDRTACVRFRHVCRCVEGQWPQSDPLQTVAFPQSSRSRHLIWSACRGSTAGAAACGDQRRVSKRSAASFVTDSYARPLEAERAARGRALTFPEQLFAISCDGSSRVRREQD
jgi:hypothetical protein